MHDENIHSRQGKSYLTISDYVRITGRSPASANRDVKSGRVPIVRIGKSVLIPYSFFENLELVAYSSQRAIQGAEHAKEN